MKRVILWKDDSAMAMYEDQTIIFIDKLGCCFHYSKNDSSITKMLTSFATRDSHTHNDHQIKNKLNSTSDSSIKRKLLQLLHYVNSHVARPYLCKPNIPYSTSTKSECTFTSNSLIRSTTWQFNSNNITLLESGAVKLTSEDGYAVLVLYPNGQQFKVTFPALIRTADQYYSSYDYTYIHQYFSIHSYPKTYYHQPLQIAMYYYQKKHNVDLYPLDILSFNAYYHTELPETKEPFPESDYSDEILLQKCKYLRTLSAGCNDTYRSVASTLLSGSSDVHLEYIADCNLSYLYLSDTQQCQLILHDDNSSILSVNSLRDDEYFVHYVFENEKPVQKVYRGMNTIPHHSFEFCNDQSVKICKSFPILKLVENMRNFTAKSIAIHQLSEKVTTSCEPALAKSEPRIKEKAVNENGKYLLYSDGSVRCRFNDRTIVTINNKSDICDVLTSNCDSIQVLVDNPISEMKWYIETALMFKNWALNNTSTNY